MFLKFSVFPTKSAKILYIINDGSLNSNLPTLLIYPVCINIWLGSKDPNSVFNKESKSE